MGRHELRDTDGNWVVGEPARFSDGGGRHSAEHMNRETFPWFQDARQWLATPTEELPPVGLGDTEVIPAVTDDEQPAVPQQDTSAEKERAADVAVRWDERPATERRFDPRDPDHLAELLDKLRHWNP